LVGHPLDDLPNGLVVDIEELSNSSSIVMSGRLHGTPFVNTMVDSDMELGWKKLEKYKNNASTEK
jgi:hypothetical protein